MSGNSYGVLIGVNAYDDGRHLSSLRFAEKDSQDLYEVLTAPETGGFLKENLTLLLGQEATTNKVKEILFKEIVQRPTSNDTVLVYFSGHGFIVGEKQRKAYLGTFDVNILNLLTKHPRAGLRMDELYEDIFLASPAKHVVFILDSCHSGAFIPANTKSLGGDIAQISTEERLIEKGFFSGEAGRVAIVSCPPNVLAYESKDFQNSVFTHYLLEGLRGGAIEQDTGEVSLDSLLTYIRNHAPSKQLPGRYGQDYGRIVLAKASSSWKAQKAEKKVSPIPLPIDLTPPTSSEVVPLRNPLEPYQQFIDRLVELLADDQPIADVENRVLEAVRRSSGADFVGVFRQAEAQWVMRAHSNWESDQLASNSQAANIIPRVEYILAEQTIVNRDYYGAYHFYEEEGAKKALMFIPCLSTPITDLMVLCGLPQDSNLLGEVCGRILSVLYSATRELTTVQVSLVEAAILDELKRIYNFVPINIYKRRFQLFQERLQQMVIYFEPILYLDPEHLHIDSWEALARNPENVSAPIDLFAAAEIWGDRFMIELDQYFLEHAVTAYRDARRRTPGRRRPEDTRELSVNVYPQSLTRPAYFNAVKRLIKNKLIQPEKLILEISEKFAIPEVMGDSDQSAIHAFREQLEAYVRELRVGFSVDDFGVGHSSISRLAGLSPTHVKIDRDILHQKGSDITLRFVLDIASKMHLRAPKVVVEGFDGSSPVTLAELHKIGIPYVQGYVVGKASSGLDRLEPQHYDYLKRLINDDDR